MALLDSELTRIKAELGWNLLGTGALPYFGTAAVFEQIIQQELLAGAKTTSSSAVTGDGTPKSITLTSATGFTSGDRFVVDVDGRQEELTTQSLSGTTLTALFAKTHSGTYPVTVVGGESIVRQLIAEIAAVRTQRAKSKGRGALKAYVGEIEYYDTKQTAFESNSVEIAALRDELAAACGDVRLNLWRNAGAQRCSVY